MSSLAWKLQRLRVMSGSELAFRAKRALVARMEGLRAGTPTPPPEPRLQFGAPWVDLSRVTVPAEPYFRAADEILAGRISIFELEGRAVGFPPDWNREPKTGLCIPLKFGKTLEYRDATLVGDIRYLWELNRHQELVTLAQAYRLSSESKYLHGCGTLVESWVEQCPYPLGPNWVSALEHGIRLMNWAVAWHLLGGADSKLFHGNSGKWFLRRWLDSIYQHCKFIAEHFSRHSSANNHLFGEYAGLFIASVTWPCWPQSRVWRETAHRGLEQEALRQIAGDGVDREQAVWYQQEVMDMMLLAGLFGRANDAELSVDFWGRLESALGYIASLMDVDGHIPAIGDGDDGMPVRFCPRHLNTYRALLAAGAVLFERADFKFQAGALDEKTRWLLGEPAGRGFDALVQERPPTVRRAFPDGGYYLLGDAFGASEEVKLVADAGALGYLSIAAHGHADALSFTLSVGGRELLVDAGTYGYAAPKPWRDFFRGTAAHNTIRIDGVDQSVSGGGFLWVKHAKAWCERFDSEDARDLWQGVHDGYQRLRDPVRHRRTIEYDKPRRAVRVTDHLECKGTHEAEVFWHFAPECDVVVERADLNGIDRDTASVQVRRDGVRVRMACNAATWRPRVACGETDPPQGWISRRYGERTPAPVVIWGGQFSGPLVLLTEITVDEITAR